MRTNIVSLRFLAHFDRAAGQVPESIVLERDGAAVVGSIVSRQVARATTSGRVEVLATMPEPADGGVDTPMGGFACVTGIARSDDGSIYFLYNAGDPELTGLWWLGPSGEPERVAAMPVASFLNGITRDERTGDFYVTDSTEGHVWRWNRGGGAPEIWATGRVFAPTEFAGANGVKVHNGAVWVSNTDDASIVRVPITADGTAGPVTTEADSLTSVDDFAFTGRGDELLVTLNLPHEVALVEPRGETSVVLTESDGLQNPTSVAVRADTAYVASGALTTGGDANILVAELAHGD